MKLPKLITLSLVLSCHLSTAWAEHDGPEEPKQALQEATSHLTNVVQRAYLRRVVKESVFRFSREVSQVSICPDLDSDNDTRNNALPIINSNASFLEHNDESACTMQLEEIQRAFRPVERFLYDTYGDLPNVHEAYLETRRALYALLSAYGQT